jgi:hypothetical protein
VTAIESMRPSPCPSRVRREPLVVLAPSLRLSLTPDGGSVTYSIAKPALNLWLIEGLSTIPLP